MPLLQWRLNLESAKLYYGVLAGGSAGVGRILTEPTSGGVIVGGEAIDEGVVFIPTGGVVIGGFAGNVGITKIVFGSGGVIIGGNQTTNGKVINETSDGGLVIGGSGSVTGGQLGDCTKDELPRHPKPSTADYRPANVSPLIEFFVPIISGVLGRSVSKTSIIFRYENNTPCRPADDIFVPHADVVGHNYRRPVQLKKSKELKAYEAIAKKSKRLIKFMQESPAQITYFNDVETVGNIDYPPGPVPYPPEEDILGIFK